MSYGRDQCLEVQAETGMWYCEQYLPSDSGRDMDNSGRTEGGTPATVYVREAALWEDEQGTSALQGPT